MAMIFFFKLLEKKSGLFTAVVSCLVLFVTFNDTMYNLFRIGVPVSYFFQMGMIYFFFSYLQKQSRLALAGMLLFLGPAIDRETTPVLLTAILLVELIDQNKNKNIFSFRNFPLVLILIVEFYLIMFSPMTSQGSVVALFPHWRDMFNFISERFFYYGTILTTKITGISILLIISVGVLQNINSKIKDKVQLANIHWIWFVSTALLLTIIFIQLTPYAIYWLVFCILYLFIFDNELRMPIAWAGASLSCFLAARYYHDGYLVESGFPLAMTMGIIIHRMINNEILLLKKRTQVYLKRIVFCSLAIFVLLIPTMLFFKINIPIISYKIDTIELAIESNKNFKQLMRYLKYELPQNAVIYELDEADINTTLLQRRFFPLKERAKIVKVMNIEDKLVMLKLLDRDDIKIYSASQINNSSVSNAYFIALNNYERKIAETSFSLAILKEFKGAHDSAAIYRLEKEIKNSSPYD
jgi:hypothetical protein